MRLFTFIMMVSFCTNLALSQSTEIAYSAYLRKSLSLWERAIYQAKSDLGQKPTYDEQLGLALAQYGYLNITMVDKDEASFNKYLGPAKQLLTTMQENRPDRGEAFAIESAILGLEIAFSPMKGMYLGIKSSALISNALEQSPNSPIVQKMYAGGKLYTPEVFGGSPKIAEEYFGKAVEAFEAIGDTTTNWLYLDALAHLGISRKKLEDAEGAIKAYEKALAVEADFHWVGKSLLPAIARAEVR